MKIDSRSFMINDCVYLCILYECFFSFFFSTLCIISLFDYNFYTFRWSYILTAVFLLTQLTSAHISLLASLQFSFRFIALIFCKFVWFYSCGLCGVLFFLSWQIHRDLSGEAAQLMSEYNRIHTSTDTEWMHTYIPECWAALIPLKAEYYKGWYFLLLLLSGSVLNKAQISNSRFISWEHFSV